MGDLKPLGSEKLSSDAKLKRILELTYYQSDATTSNPTEIIKESKSGVYGIVKEKDGYYVKKGLNEGSLDYIGGLFMKNKNKFSSYAQALKKLEFLVEQENLMEATKYVLKRPKSAPVPQEEAPAPMPTGEAPPPAATPDDSTMPPAGEEIPAAPEDELGADEAPSPEAEDEYLKIIQKLTGKLGERLRDYEDKIKSDDIKYVINMILSAVDLKKLEETDKEEILDKIDPDEEMPDENLPGEEVPGEEAPAPEPEDELGETDGMAALEELISTNPFDDEGDYPFGSDPIDFDDDEDFGELDFEDKDAEKYAQGDYDAEEAGDEDFEMGLTSKTENPDAGSFDDQEDIEEYMETTPETEDEVKEIDLDELNNIIANGVKETLGKYFE